MSMLFHLFCRSAVPWLLFGSVAAAPLLNGCHGPAADAPLAAQSLADAPASEGLALKPEEIERMGIVVTTVRRVTHVPEASGFAVVGAHEAIAQALAELMTASAATQQSSAVLDRARRLAGTEGAMPAEALESAERQSRVDVAAALLARQRSSASFGQSPPWGDKEDSPLLRALASGKSKLARVTFPLGAIDAGSTPATVRLARLDGLKSGESWVGQPVWSAPADSSVPGSSFFVLLSDTSVREGERLIAWAPLGNPAAGTLVPASAAVISENKYWCFVERRPGLFVRTALDTGTPVNQDYFVTEGIVPGDRVVTAAAGQLLARETNPAPAAD